MINFALSIRKDNLSHTRSGNVGDRGMGKGDQLNRHDANVIIIPDHIFSYSFSTAPEVPLAPSPATTVYLA